MDRFARLEDKGPAILLRQVFRILRCLPAGFCRHAAFGMFQKYRYFLPLQASTPLRIQAGGTTFQSAGKSCVPQDDSKPTDSLQPQAPEWQMITSSLQLSLVVGTFMMIASTSSNDLVPLLRSDATCL